MQRSTVLLIGKDGLEGTVDDLVREAGGVGLDVVAGLDAAYAYRAWDRVALVLIQHDRRGPTNGVIRLLRMLAASRRPVATIVLGDGLDEETESLLLRRGAAYCLARPIEPDRLAYLIDVLTLRAREADGTPAPAGRRGAWDDADPMVPLARQIAPQDTTVLIRGEAGTGKSRLATIIHGMSPRRDGALVTLHCSTLTPAAFDEPDGLDTPPSSPSARVVQASGGTVVLEEIDALSPAAQAALLRWMEESARSGQVHPGDGRTPRPRIIATTRSDLAAEAASGRFRTDLFFRLNVIGLELPPLSRRRPEIVPLAHSFLAELAGRSVTLSPSAALALESYEWRGNVRELQQAMEAALAAGPNGRSLVDRDDLPEPIRGASLRPDAAGDAGAAESTTLAQTKREAEFLRITQALQKNGNNRLRTASELGISRMTLYKKLYKYGIIEPAGGERAGQSPSRRGASGGADQRLRTAPREPSDDASATARALGPLPRIGKSAPALH